MPARAQTVAIRAGASDSEDDLATAATNGMTLYVCAVQTKCGNHTHVYQQGHRESL